MNETVPLRVLADILCTVVLRRADQMALRASRPWQKSKDQDRNESRTAGRNRAVAELSAAGDALAKLMHHGLGPAEAPAALAGLLAARATGWRERKHVLQQAMYRAVADEPALAVFFDTLVFHDLAPPWRDKS